MYCQECGSEDVDIIDVMEGKLGCNCVEYVYSYLECAKCETIRKYDLFDLHQMIGDEHSTKPSIVLRIP